MLTTSMFTKLFPILEVYTVAQTGSGILTLYSFAKGLYGSLVSFLDISILQRINASSQAMIGKGEQSRLSITLRKNIRTVLVISVIAIPAFLLARPFVPMILSHQGAYENRYSGVFYSILLSLYPFAMASIISSLVVPLLYMQGRYKAISSIAVPSCAIAAFAMHFIGQSTGVVGVAVLISIYYSANTAIFSWYAVKPLTNNRPAGAN